ncbi:RICIN domain-containing protein [Streptomyces sp. RKAG290]|uniref:RICIN domain-containing protein n=1 Tax=Streptomyces sp. RKAG290 TaxID=2888348 RepID=UPI0035A828E9
MQRRSQPAVAVVERLPGEPVSGKCLDDPGFNIANGTQLDIWACDGGANQRWNSLPEKARPPSLRAEPIGPGSWRTGHLPPRSPKHRQRLNGAMAISIDGASEQTQTVYVRPTAPRDTIWIPSGVCDGGPPRSLSPIIGLPS